MTAKVRPSPEEIQAALARAEEHLNAAQVLTEREFYNDAISRVYYGFFEAASAALLTMRGKPPCLPWGIRAPVRLCRTIKCGRERSEQNQIIQSPTAWQWGLPSP